jgi:ATP-dependent Clp protease ATP-binding subunit ClpC
MTDSHGRKVSFKNCVILMTSNVGARQLKDFGTGVGFSTKTKESKREEDSNSLLERELKKKFSPEFINRVDEIIYFKELGKEEILKIVDLEIEKTLTRAQKINYNLVVTSELKEHLVDVGYDPQYGARPLKRAIQKWIDDYVTEFIIENNPAEGTEMTITYDPESDKAVVSIPTKKKTTRKKKSEE